MAMSVDLHNLAAQIKALARRLGFDLAGIAAAHPSEYRDYWTSWLKDRRHGEMDYLPRRLNERLNPSEYLPGARTVVCVAMSYYWPLEAAPSGARGRIARYALGSDYHEVIKPKLYDIADWIREQVPGTRTRCGTDTAPIPEKELAQRAGIGWLGKNTCIIHPQAGSWLLLGEVLTTLDLPTDKPAVDRCGTCTRCLDACPTSAIVAPYRLDATKCISYLTIESRKPPPPELDTGTGDWVFGCDVCQEVCPYNSRPLQSLEPAFRPRWSSGTVDLGHWHSATDAQLQEQVRGTALKRVKLPVLRRNVRRAIRNLNLEEGTCP
jgi:epoxyqueuosine reductase